MTDLLTGLQLTWNWFNQMDVSLGWEKEEEGLAAGG